MFIFTIFAMWYYRNRYYNDPDPKRIIVLWLIVFVVWNVRKFNAWLASLDERDIILYSLLFLLFILLLYYSVIKYKKWKKWKESIIQVKKFKFLLGSFTDYDLIVLLRSIHPRDFERFVCLLFKLSWYAIEFTSSWKNYFWRLIPEKDGWIDLIVSKDGKKKYIQVKKYQNHQVSSSVARDFYGTIVDKLSLQDEWIVVSTSIFSDDFISFANEKNIKMIDYSGLLDIIHRLFEIESISLEIMNFVNSDDLIFDDKFSLYSRTCKKCFAPLVFIKKMWCYCCMNYHKTGCDYKEWEML